MREIALHLLDIAENSVAAQAHTVTMTVQEDLRYDRLYGSVQDDGKGMNEETVARIVDPFYTSRTTRKVGLGIPLLKEAAEACNGSLQIRSEIGQGTCLEVSFQHSHIDRMPLGDMAGTLLTLVVAYPEIRWIFHYQAIAPDGKEGKFDFDTQPVKAELEGVSICEPEVLSFLGDYLAEGMLAARQNTNLI